MIDSVGRLLPLQAGTPAYNMAVDQTLLESVERRARPTLRLYRWSVPTLSLGYFQRSVDRAQHSESQSLCWVRRATGGGAIVHDHELTYSLVLPVADIRVGARGELYQALHRALAEALADFSIRAVPFRMTAEGPRMSGSGGDQRPEPFLCFQRRTPEDLIVAGYKILGSAQRRSRSAVLQHGSLLLRASGSAPQLPGVEDLASRSVPLDQLIDRLSLGLASAIGVDHWNAEPLDESEQIQARQTERDRFAHPAWLDRR